MEQNIYQTIPRKKDKTDVIKKDKFLKQFVLDTRRNNIKNLESMIQEYDMIVFKPNIGGGGKNVGFIKKHNNLFHIHIDTDDIYFDNLSDVHNYIVNRNKKRKFILQKGVDLMTYNERPFDIRIEIQKVSNEWEVSGIVAKVALENKLVTNRHSGGTGTKLDQILLSKNIPPKKIDILFQKLTVLGYMTSIVLNRKYMYIREIGIDIGLDDNLYPYILEINTKPQFGVFYQLEDKTMYNRIKNNNDIILSNIDCYKREL